MRRVIGWIFAATLFAMPARAANVGYQHLHAPDGDGPSLELGVWYPTNAMPTEQRLELFNQTVAADVPLAGRGLALIVISHGSGASYAAQYDTALALAHAGFVVAAVTHPGDNHADHSREIDIQDRSRHIHAVIEYMLHSWPDHAAIDPHRIGIFGFSAGGFTALVSAGGVPDLGRVAPYCSSHAESFVCRLLAKYPPDSVTRPSADAWIADPRIRAAVVAAPAIGFTFTPDGLKRVRIPIQLWSAEDDHILPAPDYADAVRAALPRPPEFHLVQGADHFDFLAPCSEALAGVAPMICQDSSGFDRAAFHVRFNAEIVRFFKQTLPP